MGLRKEKNGTSRANDAPRSEEKETVVEPRSFLQGKWHGNGVKIVPKRRGLSVMHDVGRAVVF